MAKDKGGCKAGGAPGSAELIKQANACKTKMVKQSKNK